MVGSAGRNSKHGVVMIGPSGPVNSDIKIHPCPGICHLPTSNYCEIHYKNGFSNSPIFQESNFYEFLKLFYLPKYKQRERLLPLLSKYPRMLIYQYLREPKQFLIRDLGSRIGTFLKLDKSYINLSYHDSILVDRTLIVNVH